MELRENESRRLYYRAKEVAALCGLSLRTIYEGVYSGWIPSRKIGNSRLIPAAWVEAETDAAAASYRNNRYYFGNRARTDAGRSRLLQYPSVALRAITMRGKFGGTLALHSHGYCSFREAVRA